MPTTTFAGGESLGASMKFAQAVAAIRRTKGVDLRNPQPTHTMLLVSSTGVLMRRFDYTISAPLKPKGVSLPGCAPSRRTLAKRAARASKKRK